jgi:hypothetical protein
VRSTPTTCLLAASLVVCAPGCSSEKSLPSPTKANLPLKLIFFEVTSGSVVHSALSRKLYPSYHFTVEPGGRGIFSVNYDKLDDKSFRISTEKFAEFEKVLAPYRAGGTFEQMSPGCEIYYTDSYNIYVMWVDANNEKTILSQDIGCLAPADVKRKLALIKAHKLLPVEKMIGMPLEKFIGPISIQ